MDMKLLISTLFLATSILFGCGSDAEEPEPDESVGEEIGESMDEAADETEDAMEEAGDEMDEAGDEMDEEL